MTSCHRRGRFSPPDQTPAHRREVNTYAHWTSRSAHVAPGLLAGMEVPGGALVDPSMPSVSPVGRSQSLSTPSTRFRPTRPDTSPSPASRPSELNLRSNVTLPMLAG